MADLKAHLSEYADKAEREHERFMVTRNGKPSFVVMSTDDLEALEETIHWLSQPGVKEELTEAEDAIEAGNTIKSKDELLHSLRSHSVDQA